MSSNSCGINQVRITAVSAVVDCVAEDEAVNFNLL